MDMNLFIDIETFSSVSLPDCGVDKYSESDDFDILLLGYAFNDDPVDVIDLTQEPLPQKILDALKDDSVTKIAHNARFERTCLSHYIGEYLLPNSWLDTMVLAAGCGLPNSLDAVGEALQLSKEQAKMKEGTALVRYFCIPCKPTKTNGNRTRNNPSDAPEDWKTFIEYNRRDVETERHIYNKLIKWRPDYSEHRLWCLDQEINDKGLKSDIILAKNAIDIGDDYKNRLLAKATEISGIINPNSGAQVKAWLEEQEGVTVTSLNKKVVTDVINQLTDDRAKEFMELRTEFSKSSTKKYETFVRCACKDEHIRGCFQFNGAGRTGRWAGRYVQPQNLPQNHIEDLDTARELVRTGDAETFELIYPNVQETLSELIRTTLIPEEGHKFIVADYSAIEARVLAWIAGEQWKLDTFINGGDIYCESASQMFRVPVEKHGQNAELRQKGKIAELALGYGGTINAMKNFGADKLGMSEEDIGETVAAWRKASPRIPLLWSSLESAAIRCVGKKISTMSTVGHIRFDYEDGVMWMTLPSGRRIAYWGAEIGKNKFGSNSLTYMGTGTLNKKWTRLETWGGKLAENLTQATARDCLKESMLLLAENGFDIRGTVHDEVIITEPINGRSCEEVCDLMSQTVSWEEGLPLKAAGYECTSYRKD